MKVTKVLITILILSWGFVIAGKNPFVGIWKGTSSETGDSREIEFVLELLEKDGQLEGSYFDYTGMPEKTPLLELECENDSISFVLITPDSDKIVVLGNLNQKTGELEGTWRLQ